MTTPNVILLTLDSLRADHLPTYGYSRSTSPTLTEFGNRSDVTVFQNAFATTAWTLPSHTSLFTGLSTVRHGLYDEGLRINPEHTLAANLSKADYDTIALLNNGWLANGGVTDAFNETVDIFDMDVPSGFVEQNLNRLENYFQCKMTVLMTQFGIFGNGSRLVVIRLAHVTDHRSLPSYI